MSDVIKLHNHLGQARYRMSLTEQKLFIYAVRHIDQESSDFNEVVFRLADFAKEAGLHLKTLYREIDGITTNIMKTVIKNERGENLKGFIKYNLTQRCEYVEGEGLIKLRFNDDMRPLLLQLQKHYFLQNPEVLEFRSWYAIRLYDMLKAEAYKNQPIKTELEALKTILIVPNVYTRFNAFRERILEPAISEINEKSEIKVSWDKITHGKKVLGLLFTVISSEKNDGIVLIQDFVIAKNAEWSIEGKFDQEEIQELRKIAKMKAVGNMDPEEYIHRNYVYMAGQDNVRNPFEYLKKVLECDYANVANQITMFDEPNSVNVQKASRRKSERKNSFHNFEGRLSKLSEDELTALINKRKRGVKQ